MARRRIHLEQLLGRKVRDTSGRSAGRIEEVRAHTRNGQCLISEYLLGGGALRDRLSIPGFSLLFLRPLGPRKSAGEVRVPWREMDLSDPMRPRLRCTLEELKSKRSS